MARDEGGWATVFSPSVHYDGNSRKKERILRNTAWLQRDEQTQMDRCPACRCCETSRSNRRRGDSAMLWIIWYRLLTPFQRAMRESRKKYLIITSRSVLNCMENRAAKIVILNDLPRHRTLFRKSRFFKFCSAFSTNWAGD